MRSIITCDNFYADPMLVRTYAVSMLTNDFYYPYEDPNKKGGQGAFKPHETRNWRTSTYLEATDCPIKSSSSVIAKLENLVGAKIDMERWNAPLQGPHVYPSHSKWNCSFHHKKSQRLIQNAIHNHVTDMWNNVGPLGWVGLIYLTPDAPDDSGLTLWDHPDPKLRYSWMQDDPNWKCVDVFGPVFNRLILCRGDVPHAGGRGFGDNPATGRIYQTFFFKVLGDEAGGLPPAEIEL